jgi:hypothetical protein
MGRAPVVEVSASGDAFREEVLRAARAFKASWTGLAKVLTGCATRRCGKAGVSSFELYCSKELRIRKATALKLTRSWSFLDRHERHWRPDAPDARPLRPSRWWRCSPRPRSAARWMPRNTGASMIRSGTRSVPSPRCAES